MKLCFVILALLFENGFGAGDGGKPDQMTPVVPTITGGVLNKIAFGVTFAEAIAVTKKIEIKFSVVADSLTGDMTNLLVEKIEFQCAAKAGVPNSWMDKLPAPVEMVATTLTDSKLSFALVSGAATTQTISITNGKGANAYAAWGIVANACVVHVTFKAGLTVGYKGLVEGTVGVSWLKKNAATYTATCLGSVVGGDTDFQNLATADCTNGANPTVTTGPSIESKVYKSDALKLTVTSDAKQVSDICVGAVALTFKNCFTGYGLVASDLTYVGKVTYKEDVLVATPTGSAVACTGGLSVDCTTKSCNLHYSTTTTKATAADFATDCTVVQAGASSVSNVGVYRSMSVYAGDTTIAAFKAATDSTTTPQFGNSYGPPITSSVVYGDIQTTLTTLKADVAKIPTTTTNSSASIVPLFLLGVFGSVFALTM